MPDVDLHARVLGVLRVHVVALLVGDHLERQLVVVAQEQAPLAVVGDRGRLVEDLVDRLGRLASQRHEHARHDGEVERHVALVAVAEVLDHVGRPLVGLGEQHAIGVVRVDLGPHPLEVVVGLGEVLAVRVVRLVQVRHGVEPEAVHAEVEPEPEHLDQRVLDLGVLVVEVGLVREEPVPVIGAGLVVPGPVRRLGVGEDDARALVAVHGVRPDVPVSLGVVRAGARLLEPRVVGRRVVHDQVGDDAHAALVGRLDEVADVLDRAVVGLDREEVGDVVAAVAQRGRVERQQPDAVDAEPLQVVELLDQAAEVARPVAVAVEERPRVDLVEDRGLEPVGLGLEPVAGVVARRRHPSTRSRCAWRVQGSRRT